MCEEKNMIEINLNAPSSPEVCKDAKYFGNLRFSKTSSGFPYGQYRNEDEESGDHGDPKEGGPELISSYRQMYCPDCQERLDVEDVRLERMLYCCMPLFPFKCIYKSCVKRQNFGRDRQQGTLGRKVICTKCGSELGFWKNA